MAIGKAVVLTRGGMEKEQKEIFMSQVPKGWQPVWADMNDDEAKVGKELADAEYLICSGGMVTQKLVEYAKKLKLMETGAQDTGMIPVKYALEKGIIVANGGGANAIAVSEYVVCAMLNILKRVLPYNIGIREGKWRINLDRKGQHELFGKTVGIVGFGNIGRRVAKLCYGFGADILYTERFFVPYALRADMKAKPVSLDELLKQSDIVSIHVPSFSANKAMIGAEQLAMMKPTAYLVNTSRGANIDEKALTKVLAANKIAGAAIDVWDPEPPDPKNPLINMSNVLATPHIAGSSWENALWSADIMWRNIVLVSEGHDPVSRIREY
jgi:phosphoglycerate dehydrogenase-like enzyme